MRGAPQVRSAAAGVASPPLVSTPRSRREAALEAGPIDRRILARRRAVAEEEGRRRLHRALWLGGSVALAATVLGATRTPLLDLDHVRVEAGAPGVLGAEEQAAVDATLDAVGIRAGAPLVDLDLTAGEEALEALPWVADAEVLRRWPGTVAVEVQARVPVALVATAGGVALVDHVGQVSAVVPAAEAPDGLVAVAGPPDLAAGDRLEAEGPLAVAEAVPEGLASMVARVAGGDGSSVVLHLHDGAVVDLGPPLGPADVADKLHAALTMLTQVDRTCLDVLDVSVPSVPTVTRRPGC